MSDPIKLVNAYWQGDSIVVVTRDDAGRRRRRAYPAEYACFVKQADLPEDLERKIRTWPLVRSLKREGDYLRIGFRSWSDLKEATYRLPRPHPKYGGMEPLFERLGIPTFEADVYPVRRFLTDNDVELQAPHRCFLDIETDSRVPFKHKEDARILSWALVGEDGEWVGSVLDGDTDADERRLLVELWEELDRFDQVLAWSGGRFDFPVIRARTQLHGIGVAFSGWLWLDHLELFKQMNMHASESGDEKQSFSLGRIATAVLGETKDDLDASRTWEYWVAGGAKREELFRYNVRDADLLRLIEAKTGFVELLQAICTACTTLPDSRGQDGTNFVEGYLLKMGKTRGLKFRTHWRGNVVRGEQFEGAYVLEPTRKGILRNVHVADFAGMYPSIIETWNISPETLRPDVCLKETGALRPSYMLHVPLREYPLPPECCSVPGASVFNREPMGILPEAISDLKRLRKVWNDRKAALPPGTPEWKDADRRSNGYKVTNNTFYGVTGAPTSRFFVREVAESVTAAGRWLIQRTIEAAAARGWEVVYCDTDSIFVMGVSTEEFGRFVAWCNEELYPKLLKELGCPRNTIKIAYEKEFDLIVLLKKKRYAGRFAHYKGTRATTDSKPEIKGLEFKRGDSVRMARELQLEIVMAILDGNVDEGWYRAKVGCWRAQVLKAELGLRDFVLSKTLSNDVEDYAVRKKKDGTAAAQPPHVEVAKELAKRDRDVGAGTRIEYVVVDGGVSPLKVIPAEDYEAGCEDRFYLWEALVWPPTERVLEVAFPGTKWSAEFGSVRPAKPRKARTLAVAQGAPNPKPPAASSPKRSRAAPEGQGKLF